MLLVRDFPKMLSFYRDRLGLPVSKIHPGKGYEPLVDWVRFEPNGPGGTAIGEPIKH
ncbi:MAG: VOC family protein [Candidatus Bathyarchaeia archaeon]